MLINTDTIQTCARRHNATETCVAPCEASRTIKGRSARKYKHPTASWGNTKYRNGVSAEIPGRTNVCYSVQKLLSSPKSMSLWVVTLSSSETARSFGGKYCLHIQGLKLRKACRLLLPEHGGGNDGISAMRTSVPLLSSGQLPELRRSEHTQ
jgi:hypothetical protein